MINSLIYLLFCRLKSRKLTNIITMALLTLSFIIVAFSLSIFNGFETSFMDKLLTYIPHIKAYGANHLLKHSDIKELSTYADVQALAMNEKEDVVQGVLIRGMEKKDLANYLSKKTVSITGSLPQENNIVIGKTLAESLNISQGDPLTLLTGPAVFKETTISAIADYGLHTLDSTVILAPYEDVLAFTPMPGEGLATPITEYQAIWVENPLKVSAVKQYLESHNPNILISTWMEENKPVLDAIKLEKTMAILVFALLLILTAVAVCNAQVISVISQKDQIAIAVAIGVSQRLLPFMFVLEAFFLSLASVCVGFIILQGILTVLTLYPITIPLDIYHTNTLIPKISLVEIGGIAFLTVLLSVVFSFIPAFMASRLNPVEIFKRG